MLNQTVPVMNHILFCFKIASFRTCRPYLICLIIRFPVLCIFRLYPVIFSFMAAVVYKFRAIVIRYKIKPSRGIRTLFIISGLCQAICNKFPHPIILFPGNPGCICRGHVFILFHIYPWFPDRRPRRNLIRKHICHGIFFPCNITVCISYEHSCIHSICYFIHRKLVHVGRFTPRNQIPQSCQAPVRNNLHNRKRILLRSNLCQRILFHIGLRLFFVLWIQIICNLCVYTHHTVTNPDTCDNRQT